MKKSLLGAGLMLLTIFTGVFTTVEVQAIDTVVVGQPYYGYGGGGYYGGGYGGYGPGVYPGGGFYGANPNPAFSAVGASPYFLGAMGARSGAVTRQEVRQGLRNANTIFYAPVPGNVNYEGAGYIGGGDPNVFDGPLVNYNNGVYAY